MDPLLIKKTIKQLAPGYLPYFVFTFLNLTITKTSTYGPPQKDLYPIGIILGPSLTIGNMALASSSNSNMLNELNKYNILQMDIQKGETVYGLIGIRDFGYNPITLKLRK